MCNFCQNLWFYLQGYKLIKVDNPKTIVPWTHDKKNKLWYMTRSSGYKWMSPETIQQLRIIELKKYCLKFILQYRYEMNDIISCRPDWMRVILIKIWLEQYNMVKERFKDE